MLFSSFFASLHINIASVAAVGHLYGRQGSIGDNAAIFQRDEPARCAWNGGCLPGARHIYPGSRPCPEGSICSEKQCWCEIPCSQSMLEGCKSDRCKRERKFLEANPVNRAHALNAMSHCHAPVKMSQSMCNYDHLFNPPSTDWLQCEGMFQYADGACLFNRTNFDNCQKAWNAKKNADGSPDLGFLNTLAKLCRGLEMYQDLGNEEVDFVGGFEKRGDSGVYCR
ncbi:hypothetical protein BGZ63DRAFT_404550 [Mariannaea sp. PMI_226]|nr:hypothetical protein BGZ63DRAFT_404550 [Mariannaea sp. PMI_226]